jgi:hypothetical protein
VPRVARGRCFVAIALTSLCDVVLSKALVRSGASCDQRPQEARQTAEARPRTFDAGSCLKRLDRVGQTASHE